MGQLELEVKGDISGASKGYEAGLKYAYPYQVGRTRISPHVGVAYLSNKLANYYYGTLPLEVAHGVVDYKPGSATVPRIGVDVMRPSLNAGLSSAMSRIRSCPERFRIALWSRRTPTTRCRPSSASHEDFDTTGLAQAFSLAGQPRQQWQNFPCGMNNVSVGNFVLYSAFMAGRSRFVTEIA